MSEFPYEYGSDLHWFWGWGKRLRDWLDAGVLPSSDTPAIFKPDKKAADAMVRLSRVCPQTVKPTQDALDQVEALFQQFDGNEAAAEDLCEAMDVLQRRIEAAARTIAEDAWRWLTKDQIKRGLSVTNANSFKRWADRNASAIRPVPDSDEFRNQQWLQVNVLAISDADRARLEGNAEG